jgi:hypothetical protein
MLSPGCAVLQSAYPVAAIVQLHNERYLDAHTAARGSISNRESQTALVWRQGFRPMLDSADAASAAFIGAILQGESLAVALDTTLTQTHDFDFSVWLNTSVQNGLLMGVR